MNVVPWWPLDRFPSAEEWQAYAAWATVFIAIAAAWVALVQHRSSVRARLEQSRPVVIVDFAFVSAAIILLEVKNSGLTAAKDVRFDWAPLPVAEDEVAQRTIDRSLVNDGIPFLAPGRVISFWLGSFKEETEPRRYVVNASYTGSGDGRPWESESVLDLDQWAEAIAERDANEPITAQLKAIARSLRGSEDADKQVTKAAYALELYLEETAEVQAGHAKARAAWDARARRHQENVQLRASAANGAPDADDPSPESHETPAWVRVRPATSSPDAS